MTTLISDGPADTATTSTTAPEGTEAPAGSQEAAAQGADGGQQAAPAAKTETTAAAKTTEEPKTKEDGADGASGDKPKADAVPEKYEDFKFPEGFEAPEGFGSEISTLAKELGLSQEKAQLVADKAASLVKATNDSVQVTLKEAMTRWEAEITADPQIGGEKLNENLAIAKAGLKAFDPEDKLLDVLKQSGLGSHPDVVRTFHRIGLTVKETDVVTSSKGAPGEPMPLEKRLYPNMK